jgi:hypothetical protein
LIIISAMSNDRVIGSGEGMPWSVPEEYQQFLSLVEGQTVIMGWRSYQIFGPDLTSAHNVVISRSGVDQEGVIVCDCVEAAVERASSFTADQEKSTVPSTTQPPANQRGTSAFRNADGLLHNAVGHPAIQSCRELRRQAKAPSAVTPAALRKWRRRMLRPATRS